MLAVEVLVEVVAVVVVVVAVVAVASVVVAVVATAAKAEELSVKSVEPFDCKKNKNQTTDQHNKTDTRHNNLFFFVF